MSFQKYLVISMVVVAGLSGVSCSGGDGAKSENVVDKDLSEYSKASCQYKFNEGPGATRAASNISTVYFGKKIDSGLLRPVLGASGAEVIRFAEATNVKFYKTKAFNKSDSCEFLASLPMPPSDLQKRFDEGGGDSTIGLYQGIGSRDTPSVATRAAIMVRSDANKWVLVHEYMHHLFELEVVKTGTSGDALQAKMAVVIREFKAAISEADYASGARKNAAVKKMVSKYGEYARITLQVMRQYYLEEMTIETLLAEKHASSELSLVVEGQRLNGAGYVLSSDKNAKGYLDKISEVDTGLTEYSYYMDQEDRAVMSSVRNEVTQVKSTMASLSDRAKKYFNDKGYKYTGLIAAGIISADGENSHAGCARNKEADRILGGAEEIHFH